MATTDMGDDVHISSSAWRSVLWRKTRIQRRALFQLYAAYPVGAYVLAVVQIQRVWRGILLRRRVLSKYLYKNFRRRWKTDEEELLKEYRDVPRPADEMFLSVLKRVQARFRCCLMRREYLRWLYYERFSIYWVSATTIQRYWHDYRYRRYEMRNTLRTKLLYLTREDAAAARIQDMWQRYINRQIYRFYVDLIKFRERGDPQLMLKCINPREASIMDAASGVHVRFRLGGATFPPTIYYKIFTHAPVADICRFAPKDYTRSRKKPTPAMIHNYVEAPKDDRSQWYRRQDHNEWRPISDKALQDAESIVADRDAPYTLPKEAQPASLPTIKRKEAAKRTVKEKRRKWLMQLYTQEQKAQGTAPKERVEREAQTLFDSLTDHELEEEVNRLVQWTRDLDFKNYRSDWLLLATTAGSDYELQAPEDDETGPTWKPD